MSVSVRVKRASMIIALGAAIAGTGLVLRPTVSHAQQAAAADAPGEDMDKMNGALRTLRMQITDATKNDSSLTMLATIESGAMDAKGKMPPLITAMPEADRPAKVAAYKTEMNKLIRQILDAEDALLAGDNAKAGEAITAMVATEAEGHSQFRPQRGGRAGGRGGAGGGRGPGAAGGAAGMPGGGGAAGRPAGGAPAGQ